MDYPKRAKQEERCLRRNLLDYTREKEAIKLVGDEFLLVK